MQSARLPRNILAQASSLPEGIPITAKSLLHLGSRAAVDQALSRLTQQGALLRAGRGVYVVPIESRFGQRAPSVEKTLAALAAQRGETIVPSGAMAANMLGLTKQVPIKSIYLTSGHSRILTLGNQKVELRHAPAWQLVLADKRTGQVVRALAWLGPEFAGSAPAAIQQILTMEERAELALVVGRLPDWLAATVSRLAHG